MASLKRETVIIQTDTESVYTDCATFCIDNRGAISLIINDIEPLAAGESITWPFIGAEYEYDEVIKIKFGASTGNRKCVIRKVKIYK